MDLDGVDILFIENVGNLVCPASFDLGQHFNVTLLSVTEGDDKPAKYPVMFRAADAMLLTKIDLLAVLDDFDPDKAEAHLRNLANPAPMMRLSARKGAGMDAWFDWLRGQLAAQRARVALGQSRRPAVQADGQKFHGATA
jgi:hydrogenase nickel incorporation protein HypB